MIPGVTGTVMAAPIFHIGRCGSTVLTDMLQKQPRLRAQSEIYTSARSARAPGEPFDMAAFTRDHVGRQLASLPEGSALLFEVKFLSTLDLRDFAGSIGDYLDLLVGLGIRKAVILKRENLIRRLVSTALAVARGAYQLRGDEAVDLPMITLPVNGHYLGFKGHIAEVLALIDREYAELERAAAERGFDLLHLSYEQHIETDPQVALEMVVRFLGQQPVPCTTTFRRINDRPLSEIVRNLPQVRRALQGTPYLAMAE
jgi:LPS sulfotransferase NodH